MVGKVTGINMISFRLQYNIALHMSHHILLVLATAAFNSTNVPIQSHFLPCTSLARPTFRCILFDGEIISFDTSLVIYIYTNIRPIMIINRIYENQNLLSL